jgi:tetratricopeptide (TPR) repeat protein
MALRTLALDRGLLGIALVVLAAALSLHCGPGDPIEEARALQAAGRHEEVLALLGPLIDQGDGDPDPELLLLYGMSQRRQGRAGLGLWALHQASLSEGWEVAAGLEFAAAATEALDWKVAIDAATSVIEIEPDNLYALVLRAEARMEDRSDYEGALADFERAIELDPENMPLRITRAANLLLLGRVDEAQELIAQLEELAAEGDFSLAQVAGYCVVKAIFERESDRLDEADAAFDGCLQRYPADRWVVARAVEHYDGRGQPARSNEILAALIESQPEAFVQRAQLARRMFAVGEHERARALLRAGTEVEYPFAASYAWAALAEFYVEDGRFADAAEAFGRARALEGDQGRQRILAHAELLALAGENARALDLAEELGDHFFRHMIYARVSLNERKPAEALEHLDELLEQWPGNAGAHYYAGRAAERIGDWTRAVDAYRNSIRAGAQQTDSGLKLAQLHLAEGKYQEAFVAVQHHLKEHPRDLEAALLGIEISTWLSAQQLRVSMRLLKDEGAWARVAVVLARATAERRDAEAAIELLRADRRIDLEDPRDAEALEALALYLVDVGRTDEALAMVERVLAQHPDEARLHWIVSRLTGGPRSQDALERALALAPRLEPASVAMAYRRAEAGEVEAAVELLESLTDASPERLLDLAQVLAAAGRTAEAEARLEDMLWERPHHAEAALQLALLRLERAAGAEPRTLELAQRAVRFRGGADAYRVLAEVLEARGESEPAAKAREKAAAAG